MVRAPWNRNVHYHDIVLRAVPPRCGRALDVGCGEGRLAGELAEICGEVIGIDSHAPTLARARAKHQRHNLSFVDGDAMTHPFAPESFDFVSAVATLHHLPLEPGLRRMNGLLRPDGVLVVVGLYRLATADDYLVGAAATLASLGLRLLHGTQPVDAPVRDPDETLREIRRVVDSVLPGAHVKREFFYRYSLVWRKPRQA